MWTSSLLLFMMEPPPGLIPSSQLRCTRSARPANAFARRSPSVRGHSILTTQSYYDKISHKTACLIAACCKGGAIVSLASDEDIRFLYDYGMNLGIAFQIIDDILDYTEDQATIGKPAGNDLRQGMVTLPL